MAIGIFSNPSEGRAFLCHVWLSLSCIIMAAIFFGVSSVNKVFIFGGAFFLVVSLFVFVLYFIRRPLKSRTGKRGGHCCWKADDENCCFYCCDSCMRTIFCLAPRVAAPRHISTRRALNRALSRREEGAISSVSSFVRNMEGIDNPAMTTSIPRLSVNLNTDHGLSQFSQSEVPLRTFRSRMFTLQSELQELLHISSHIENQLADSHGQTDESLLRQSLVELVDIHACINAEFRLLGIWEDCTREVPHAEVDRMQNTLQELRRRLHFLEPGARGQPSSEPASISQSSQSTLGAIVGVASLTAPLPPLVIYPSLSVPQEPLPPAPPQNLDLPPPYRENDVVHSGDLQVGCFQRTRTENMQLPYYLIPPPEEPPPDGYGAPPSYEEAASSQV